MKILEVIRHGTNGMMLKGMNIEEEHYWQYIVFVFSVVLISVPLVLMDDPHALVLKLVLPKYISKKPPFHATLLGQFKQLPPVAGNCRRFVP